MSGGLERRFGGGDQAGDKPRRREISGDAPTPPRHVAVYLSMTLGKRRKDGIINELEYVGHYGNYPRFSGLTDQRRDRCVLLTTRTAAVSRFFFARAIWIENDLHTRVARNVPRKVVIFFISLGRHEFEGRKLVSWE